MSSLAKPNTHKNELVECIECGRSQLLDKFQADYHSFTYSAVHSTYKCVYLSVNILFSVFSLGMCSATFASVPEIFYTHVLLVYQH